MADIEFIFTEGQQKVLCEHYKANFEELAVWEICELLDRAIADICTYED